MADEKLTNELEILDNLIVLQDGAGNDVRFEFLDLVEYDGRDFVVLLPEEGIDNEEIEEVVILEVVPSEEDPEMEDYLGVEDAETLDIVFEMFKERFKDEFNFMD